MVRLRYGVLIALAAAVCLLAGCGRGELLSDVTISAAGITPNADGLDDSVTISYMIGQPARVTVYLEGQDGTRYTLRENAPRVASGEPYSLRFDGTVAGDEPGVVQQVVPDGSYRVIVEAEPEAGGPPQTDSGTVAVSQAARLPEGAGLIEDLQVTQSFSPNEDAQDDVAYFSYRLPVTATVSIDITDPSGAAFPLLSAPEGPFAQSHLWDGKRPDGALVDSGTYTYTIVAQDEVGNISRREGNILVDNPGRSEARISFVHIAPVEIALGDTITLTVRVKNTGTVPIRTQGPASGFSYTTDETFSSIASLAEQNQPADLWAEKGGGFWRVGLDWGGGRSYPFRWALSPRPPEQWAEPGEYDYLQPGEEVEVTGSVEVRQREDRMQFYAGLVHEGVGFPDNNKGRTLVCVGIPGIEDKCPRRQP